jgi:uncharacterized membrane protein YphA (DoxX/SURF4 family)
MPTLSVGRVFFGLATAASGVVQLVIGDFVRLVPKVPAWLPAPSVWAFATGVILLAIGLSVLTGKMTRPALLLLVAMILLDLALVYAPSLVWNPGMDRPYLVGFMWTNPLKALALIGGALMLGAISGNENATRARAARLALLGAPLLALFLVVCGIQHFVYSAFVTTLVPAWMPAREFWTYFTGVALIAGGAGILMPRTARLAAMASATMIFLWVLLLHIPRALAGPNHANETAGVFEALAISGVALLVAGTRSPQSD